MNKLSCRNQIYDYGFTEHLDAKKIAENHELNHGVVMM